MAAGGPTSPAKQEARYMEFWGSRTCRRTSKSGLLRRTGANGVEAQPKGRSSSLSTNPGSGSAACFYGWALSRYQT
jgi:hypothetical protein